ncbi:CMGC/SRPK protein kinase [Penicillium digitatum]|uniref:CMGC/SRPK protein kinase n=1 Tax=Penicillium digitatum TaxID=36651 RepID=A0A7T6XM42_PENDI|nr:CMGC/SRPK protein kinase [Penicillium digitatum]
MLHKLGWGGYSTVWAARDQRNDTYITVKICVAESHGGETRASKSEQIGISSPLSRTFDTIDTHFSGRRLPRKLAKVIAKQSLVGINSLHQQEIAHRDLHTRNLAFTIPRIDKVTKEKFTETLGKPEIG